MPVHLFTEFAGLPERGVPDPFGRPQAAHDACRDLIGRAVDGVVARWRQA